MKLLPELAERDAAGEAAFVYSEIRRLGGVPMVALIFRHLATRPGVLEWAWEAIGPAWRSGTLQEAAWKIARLAPLEPLVSVPRAALAALGVDGEGEREVRAVLDAYNRANPENMLSMLCLLRLAGGVSASQGRLPQREWTPPAAPGPLPPMVDPAAMPRAVSDLLDLVAAPGEPGGPRVVQSLYRHFVHRPAFLAMAVTLLRARFDDGSIDRAVGSIHASMGRAADELVRSLAAPPIPDAGVLPVLRQFSGGVIPQMIVVGRLLEEAL